MHVIGGRIGLTQLTSSSFRGQFPMFLRASLHSRLQIADAAALVHEQANRVHRLDRGWTDGFSAPVAEGRGAA